MHKFCPKCKMVKDVSEFHKMTRAKDGLQRRCISCVKASSEEHYKLNKERIVQRKRAHRQAAQQRFELWKSTLTCSRCEESDPCCLEFHHLDPTEKDDAISSMVYTSNVSWGRLMNEVAKCIVVCSNCHKKIHYYEK